MILQNAFANLPSTASENVTEKNIHANSSFKSITAVKFCMQYNQNCQSLFFSSEIKNKLTVGLFWSTIIFN